MPKVKAKQESVNAKLALVLKSGKFTLGYKTTIDALRTGRAKLVLIAQNCPLLRKSELQYYAMLSGANIHHFKGSLLKPYDIFSFFHRS